MSKCNCHEFGSEPNCSKCGCYGPNDEEQPCDGCDCTPMCQTPKVTLMSCTEFPLETVYALWEQSKTELPLRTPQQIRTEVRESEVEKLFRAVIKQRIPIGEHIHFNFVLENVSISWREQAVRHRIGTKPGPERIGADIVMEIGELIRMGAIPNLHESSWWSQSMRIQNMGEFASKKRYRMPETILKHPNHKALESVYHRQMASNEETYNYLVAEGIPMEDARELIPLGAQHRISWDLNIGSLQHIVGKRGCWILQLGIWGPVIMGMISELTNKVHPIFGELVTPPCLNDDNFTGCVYLEEVRRRYTGEDKLPPCPLHLQHHQEPDMVFPLQLPHVEIPMKSEMVERAEQYRKFWNRDPYSGTRTK